MSTTLGLETLGVGRDVGCSWSLAGGQVELRPAGLGGRAEFRARPSTPGITCYIPEQSFVETRDGNNVLIRSIPEGKLPLLTIELVMGNGTGIAHCKRFNVEHADRSVMAYLLSTRLMFCAGYGGRLQLIDSGGVLLDIRPEVNDEWRDPLRRWSSVVRKLRYIETVFNISFTIPKVIDQTTLLTTDLIVRGITRGECTIRLSDFPFKQLDASALQLGGPPFTSPGTFSRKRFGDPSEISVEFLGQKIYLGPYTITLPMAEISDPSVLDTAIEDGLPVDLSFAVLDHQVRYRFEDYVGRVKEGQRKLALFKQELAKDEPVELVDLIDESVQADVSSHEAISIGNGWLQFNNFPDAYSAWSPIVDLVESAWKVPIHLAYPSGKGGPVGELVIDAKTGVVRQHTEVKAIRARGRELAKQILNAG
jgi:hypothetical protein